MATIKEPTIGTLKDGKVYRFNKAFVVAHAIHTVTFLLLLLTGLAIFSPANRWIATLFGGMQSVRIIHRVVAIPYALGALIVLLVGGGKQAKEWLKITFTWGWSDITFMPKYVVTEFMGRHGNLPESDFINPGEKVNSLLSVLTWLGFTISGVILWFPDVFPKSIVLLAYPIHDLCMLFMTMMFLVHAFLSLIHPKMRTALQGIMTGWVDARFAEGHYAKWYRRVTGKNSQ